ncbi:MAG TPA: PepSY domain-containing protein [Bryobacteraceae bacterium]|nr:PepSY domain-containing protein [Bryobacteraceae bacterium]
MGKRFYIITRDLHLYIGLFLSPFVLIFAVSVFYLVHPTLNGSEAPAPKRLVTNLPITEAIESLSGRELVNALRPALDRAAVKGEIGFIQRIPKAHRLAFTVSVPGRETEVDLNVSARSATISEHRTGISSALVYLHKMPGPHNADIRANSTFLRAWRVLADVAGYGLLFLTLSGVYLWAVLRAERRTGIALLLLGAASFLGVIYAIAH